MSLLFATLTASICYGRKTIQAIKRIRPAQWKFLVLQAVFGVFLFRVCLTTGLNYTSAVEAGIITGSSPAITGLLAWIILREPIKKKSVFGISLTLAGVLLLQGFPFNMAAFNARHLIGNLFALGAAACESLFTTLSRKSHIDSDEEYKLPPLAQAGVVSMIALLLCVVPMLMEKPIEALQSLPVTGWLALVWYGSIVTVAAFACMFAGAKRCDGYTIAAFTGVIPVSALALSLAVLKETAALHQIIGCGLIVMSIVILSGRPRRGRIHSLVTKTP
jgi:drug/metabolite transporter (DMT)-like permease